MLILIIVVHLIKTKTKKKLKFICAYNIIIASFTNANKTAKI